MAKNTRTVDLRSCNSSILQPAGGGTGNGKGQKASRYFPLVFLNTHHQSATRRVNHSISRCRSCDHGGGVSAGLCSFGDADAPDTRSTRNPARTPLGVCLGEPPHLVRAQPRSQSACRNGWPHRLHRGAAGVPLSRDGPAPSLSRRPLQCRAALGDIADSRNHVTTLPGFRAAPADQVEVLPRPSSAQAAARSTAAQEAGFHPYRGRALVNESGSLTTAITTF
jgi:hypothetical protein